MGENSMRKKFFATFAIVLAVIIMLSVAPPMTVNANPSSWARDTVNEAIALGIVPASLRTNYQNAITRLEFATLAVGLFEHHRGVITGRVQFNDTTNVNVQKAAYVGIVGGVGNSNFAPNNNITREQAAVLMSNLARDIGHPLPASNPTFADNNSISSWARAGVGQVQAAGIMGGVGNNRFEPSGTFTREASIVTIMRLHAMLPAAAPVSPGPGRQPETPAPTAPRDCCGSPHCSTRSEITLPNRRLSAAERQIWIDEYNRNGGLSEFEREMIRLVNAERARHGLRALAICHELSMAARFYAQQKANLNLNIGHDQGPYGGSVYVADVFATNTGWWGGNATAGLFSSGTNFWEPIDKILMLMESPFHRDNILNPNFTRIGQGAHLGGRWGAFTYQQFACGTAVAPPR